MKYEYKFVVRDPIQPSTEDALNILGADGWHIEVMRPRQGRDWLFILSRSIDDNGKVVPPSNVNPTTPTLRRGRPKGKKLGSDPM